MSVNEILSIAPSALTFLPLNLLQCDKQYINANVFPHGLYSYAKEFPISLYRGIILYPNANVSF